MPLIKAEATKRRLTPAGHTAHAASDEKCAQEPDRAIWLEIIFRRLSRDRNLATS